MWRKLIVLLSLLVITVPAWSAERTLLRLHGSNTIGAELAPALVKAWFERKHYTEVTQKRTAAEEMLITAVSGKGEKMVISIKAHGSSTSFKGLAAEEADIGMASRPIKDKELALLAPLGRMDAPGSEFVLGLDGIAVIVHSGNPLTQLSKKTLKKIFSGEVTDWSEIGGTSGPIHVYARDDKSGTYDTFKSLVLGKKRPLVEGARRFESNANLSDAVSVDPNGIGFVGLPYIRQAKAVAVIDGGKTAILPDDFTVATEDYALARRLFLYLPAKSNNSVAREFIDFALSSAGQQVVSDTGFVSQEIIVGTAIAAGKVHSEYLAVTNGARRLSLNFRFHRGSAVLDNKAHHDIQRLIDYVQREKEVRELILIGFSDQLEAIPMHSLALSIQRADRIADVLISNGVAPQRVRGFGPAVTIASNDTPQGREKNRRVEVWVR